MRRADGPARAPGGGVDVQDRSRQGEERRRRPILCARCGHEITHERARIEVAGAHEHTCANPHGFAYRIGCFDAAPGCGGAGAFERAFSWFPGYAWQVAVCRRCHGHLGWLFRAGGDGFAGLILDRLVRGGE